MAFIQIANYIINTDQITDINLSKGFDTVNIVYLSNGRSYLLSDKDLDKILSLIKFERNQ